MFRAGRKVKSWPSKSQRHQRQFSANSAMKGFAILA
jgi:hypothetical protein